MRLNRIHNAGRFASAVVLLGLAVAPSGAGSQQSGSFQSVAPQSVSDGALRELQSTFLSGPIQRGYLQDDSAASSTIDRADLELTNLAAGSNRKLYPKLDRVRASIADDHVLALF